MKYGSRSKGPMEVSEMPTPHILNALKRQGVRMEVKAEMMRTLEARGIAPPNQKPRPSRRPVEPSDGSMIAFQPLRFPFDHINNRIVTDLPVHGSSAAWVASFITADSIFAFDQSTYGVPVQYVSSETQPMTFDDAAESDNVIYPAIDGSIVDAFGSTDSAWLAFDQQKRAIYEVYSVHVGDPTKAFSGSYWSLNSNALRTDGHTSASESGLPVSTSICRYEEVRAATPQHALIAALSWPAVKNSYVWPARHVAVRAGASAVGVPLGSRIRLKSSYAIPGGISATTSRILQCLKTYGAFISDRSGVLSDPTMTGQFTIYMELDGNFIVTKAELSHLTGIPSALEFVDESGVQLDPNSGICTQP